MGDDILAQIGRGNWPSTGPGQMEVICSVARQLAWRLDKLIDVIERGVEEEEPPAPSAAPYTPMGRLAELIRLDLANFPKDHRTEAVGILPVILASNPYAYTRPVLVTNLDNALFLYYGTATLAVLTNAPFIPPETAYKLLIPPSQDLYVVGPGPANITVAISNLALPVV